MRVCAHRKSLITGKKKKTRKYVNEKWHFYGRADGCRAEYIYTMTATGGAISAVIVTHTSVWTRGACAFCSARFSHNRSRLYRRTRTDTQRTPPFNQTLFDGLHHFDDEVNEISCESRVCVWYRRLCAGHFEKRFWWRSFSISLSKWYRRNVQDWVLARILNVGSRCCQRRRHRRQAKWVTNYNREHLLQSRWRRRKNGNNFIAFSVSHYRMRCYFSFSAVAHTTSTRKHQQRRPDGFDFSNLFFDYFVNAAEAAALCCFFFFFISCQITMNSPLSSLSVLEREKTHVHRIPFESISFMWSGAQRCSPSTWLFQCSVFRCISSCDTFHCQLSEMNIQCNGIFVSFEMLKSWFLHFHGRRLAAWCVCLVFWPKCSSISQHRMRNTHSHRYRRHIDSNAKWKIQEKEMICIRC